MTRKALNRELRGGDNRRSIRSDQKYIVIESFIKMEQCLGCVCVKLCQIGFYYTRLITIETNHICRTISAN